MIESGSHEFRAIRQFFDRSLVASSPLIATLPSMSEIPFLHSVSDS